MSNTHNFCPEEDRKNGRKRLALNTKISASKIFSAAAIWLNENNFYKMFLQYLRRIEFFPLVNVILQVFKKETWPPLRI